MSEEAPKSLFQKLGAALPIALTAIATAFAGLSSSEMSRAMFWRSVAAQDQAKAASQWNFAGFKRDRSMMAENTLAILNTTGKAPAASTVAATPTPGIVEAVRKWMQSPDSNAAPVTSEAIRSVLDAILKRSPEKEVVALAGNVSEADLEAAIHEGHIQANAVESTWDAEAGASRSSVFKFDVDSRRYRAESTMNFWLGYLYEVRVKTSTFQSERHRIRSENFFYAMLGAQVGATIASLALARRTGNMLWLLAGIAGIVAIIFGGYVYLGL